MSMLKQNTTKIGEVDQALLELEKFEAKNNKKYEFKAIIDNAVYGQQVNNQI